MRRLFRLEDGDLLSEAHFPIKAVLNMVSDERFIRVLQGISDGRGFGENYGACIFPDDLDEYDIATQGTFVGVEFGLHSGETIIIDNKTLLDYLIKICNGYISDFPESRLEVEKLLEKYRDKFNND